MATTGKAPPVGSVVLDSSCWLEFFAGTSRADLFAGVTSDPSTLIVLVITVYEVFKVARREFGNHRASEGIAYMRRGRVIDIRIDVALHAATLGLPLADSLIYATAQAHHATLWTQDAHFEALPNVKYFPKLLSA